MTFIAPRSLLLLAAHSLFTEHGAVTVVTDNPPQSSRQGQFVICPKGRGSWEAHGELICVTL